MKKKRQIRKLLLLVLLSYIGYRIGGLIGLAIVLVWWLMKEM